MHRIGLFCLLMFQAQIGLSQQQADTTRDFGWMIDKEDGALVYIVQVAPTQATQMQLNRLENLSDIPPELVGRATRISVRIGSDQLPRSPSLAEIRKMPRYGTANDVTAALGPGRISDLEPGSVFNVQGQTLPNSGLSNSGLPGSGPVSGPTLPSQDFASSGQRGPTLPSSGSDSGVKPPTLPPVGFGGSAATTTGQGSQDARGMSSSSPPSFGQSGFGNAPANPQVRTPTLPNNQASPSNGIPETRSGNDNGLARGWMSDQRSGNSYPGTPTLPSNPNAENYAGPSDRGSGGIRSPVPNFGSAPGGYSTDGRQPPPGYAADNFSRDGSSAQNGYTDPGRDQSLMPGQQRVPASPIAGPPGISSGSDGYGNRPQTRTDYARNSGDWSSNGQIRNPNSPGNFGSAPPPAGRNSAETGMLTDTNGSSASDRNRANAAEQNAAAAPQTNASGSADGNSVASAGSVLIQMFFLVSLVANVYLVFLIRKLLHRYRSLLTTVRSQTA